MEKSTEKIGQIMEKCDMLELAKIYMGDRITYLEGKVKEMSLEFDDEKTKFKDLHDRVSVKDTRMRKIHDVIQAIKSDLLWGKFNGTSEELDELFKKVLDLVN